MLSSLLRLQLDAHSMDNSSTDGVVRRGERREESERKPHTQAHAAETRKRGSGCGSEAVRSQRREDRHIQSTRYKSYSIIKQSLTLSLSLSFGQACSECLPLFSLSEATGPTACLVIGEASGSCLLFIFVVFRAYRALLLAPSLISRMFFPPVLLDGQIMQRPDDINVQLPADIEPATRNN